MAQGQKHVTVNVGSIPTRGNEIFNISHQLTRSPEFRGKWGAECLNSRLSLPTLLHAGYSVKLKKNSITELRKTFSN